MIMDNRNGRTVLVIGAVVAAGAAVATAVSAQAPAAAPGAAAPAPPTPRTPDGKPDLQGQWTGGGVNLASGNEFINFAGRGGNFVGFEADGSLFRTSTLNKPQYKPEYWDQITENEFRGNWEDPVNSCIPLGVPRMGIPHAIYQIAGQPKLILLYQAGFNGYGGSYASWDQHRVIWTDGRPHNVQNVAYESAMGDSVAHWEGDTLVIETIGFTDSTWLHKNGWIHGFNMKVTERLTRDGNRLTWEATVEDPEYLTEPWKMTPMVANFNANSSKDAWLAEGLPCQVREPYTSPVRSG
jgi:hypothetical protein